MSEKLIELYNELNSLELDLLGPIRISKTINKEAFNQFYLLLERLKELLENEEIAKRYESVLERLQMEYGN